MLGAWQAALGLWEQQQEEHQMDEQHRGSSGLGLLMSSSPNWQNLSAKWPTEDAAQRKEDTVVYAEVLNFTPH